MSAWDSPYCLSVFNRKAGRPAADSITDASKYDRLAESQEAVIAELASIYPPALVGPTLPMLTLDHKVFTFGVDLDGNPVTPFGLTGIYTNRSSVPTCLFTEYMNEGTQIRIPNDLTHDGPLYWRGVVMPARITATVPPALFPIPSRELIVIDAVRKFATEYVRNAELADRMELEWAGTRERTGSWPKWMLTWKNQFAQGGAVGAFNSRDVFGAPVFSLPSGGL